MISCSWFKSNFNDLRILVYVWQKLKKQVKGFLSRRVAGKEKNIFNSQFHPWNVLSNVNTIWHTLFNVSAAIGTQVLTGFVMMPTRAFGQASPIAFAKSLAMLALVLNKSSRDMPGQKQIRFFNYLPIVPIKTIAGLTGLSGHPCWYHDNVGVLKRVV